MKLQHFLGLVGLAAAILVWSATPALARGGGGGGGGFSGGGHASSSSAGGGGRGVSGGGSAGRAGMRGYAPGMRGYPGYMRGSQVYSPGSRSALNNGSRQAVYRPTGVSTRSGVHSSTAKSGSSHRRSSTAASNRRVDSSEVRQNRTDRLAAANTTRTGLNHPRTGDLTTSNLKASRGGKAGRNQLARFDPANSKRFDRQTQQRLRDFNGRPSNVNEARQRHNDWCHGHHGHNWWHNHCDVIILWDWGFWGWYDGWWYPAWGYDSYYSDYPYDGPIYGYDGLPPDEAIANAQAELQRLGYYPYAPDGKLGPLTQNALNRFQRDHRLPITGTIDPSTIGALGLN